MTTDGTAVTTARITALQAIVVALITCVGTIVTTLIATGTLFGRKDGTATISATGPSVPSAPSVLDAPQMAFSARATELSLNDCLAKSRDALAQARFTGIRSDRFFSLGYHGDTVGVIWCHHRLLIYCFKIPRRHRASRFTGIRSDRFFSLGYHGDTVGVIWCHTDARQVIFLAGGKNESTTEDTIRLLDRSY